MNKYPRTPDYILDLHGRTKREVAVLLDSLFAVNVHPHVRIVTGKGNHSANGAVIRAFVKGYLNAHGLRFSQSKIEDGGEGSLEVFTE